MFILKSINGVTLHFLIL